MRNIYVIAFIMQMPAVRKAEIDIYDQQKEKAPHGKMSVYTDCGEQANRAIQFLEGS